MLYVTGFLGSELARAVVLLLWKLLLVSPFSMLIFIPQA